MRILPLATRYKPWLFFVTYVVAQPFSGWLADSYGAHRVLAVGIAIWSAATLLTGFAGSFLTLILLRLLLGVGESTTFPCMSKVIASGVEPGRIGMANGIVAFGYLYGPAIGTFAGGMLMAAYGWRPTFFLFGFLSLLWLLPWQRVVLVESTLKKEQTARPPTKLILCQRGLWGASLGHFSENYAYYFILTWLPEYLVKSRGFSMQKMAAVAGTAYLISAVSAMVSGRATDWWIRRGRSANLIYKGIMSLNHTGAIICMLGMMVLPDRGAIACLFGYEMVMGFAAPGTFAIPQILAGHGATGRWVGIQNTCGNVAGIFAPAITGFVLGATGQFHRAFLLAAAVNVLGILGWVLILPKIEPLNWAKTNN